MPSSIRLFSYGTLQQENVQLEVFGRALNGSPDALKGYSRTLVRIEDPEVIAKSGAKLHPIVSPSSNPEDAVEGQVFDVTEVELNAADAYEVSDYERVEVLLASGQEAWVYVAVST